MIKPQKQIKRRSPHHLHLCLNKRSVNPKLCTKLLMDVAGFKFFRRYKKNMRIILLSFLSRELLSCATNKTFSISVRFQYIQSQCE